MSISLFCCFNLCLLIYCIIVDTVLTQTPTKETSHVDRTDHTGRQARCTKTHILWDAAVKGLGLRITPNGAKSYILNYRINGRQRRITLARASEISLKVARQRAGEQLVRIRAGEHDPLVDRQAARHAPTVGDGLDRFFDEYVPARQQIGRFSQRTEKEYRRQARRHLQVLADHRIADVTRDDVEHILAGLPRVTRNRVLQFVTRLFNLFEQWGWRPQRTSPCFGIELAREEPRDRVLSPDELAAFARALADHEKQHPASVAAIRVAALTGLRIGEVLAIQWQHIDFSTGRLTLPDTKTGRRGHDLADAVLAVLAGLPRFGPWVFTTRGEVAIAYKTVRRHFAAMAKAAGLHDVRLHDLRRTVMTRAAASGIGTHVLRDLLGHKSAVVADRYIRALGDPVRTARQAISAEMAAMMSFAEEAKPSPPPQRTRTRVPIAANDDLDEIVRLADEMDGD